MASTPSGSVRGVLRGGGCTYLGIPYAAPPVGDLRWKPPQPKTPWAPAVLSATSPPPTCSLINPPTTGQPSGNEDCLMLNIWAPSRPARAPVIVWFHTGGFQAASANFAASNGERFAQETNAIVVAPNYRLGPFGFLAHSAFTLEDPAYRSSGNYGLLASVRHSCGCASTLRHLAATRATSRSPEHQRGARASAYISCRRRPPGCSIGPSCKAGWPQPAGRARRRPRLRANSWPGLFSARM